MVNTVKIAEKPWPKLYSARRQQNSLPLVIISHKWQTDHNQLPAAESCDIAENIQEIKSYLAGLFEVPCQGKVIISIDRGCHQISGLLELYNHRDGAGENREIINDIFENVTYLVLFLICFCPNLYRLKIIFRQKLQFDFL